MSWTPEQISAVISAVFTGVTGTLGIVVAYIINSRKEDRRDRLVDEELKKKIIEEVKKQI